jgi:hypothetical protein
MVAPEGASPGHGHAHNGIGGYFTASASDSGLASSSPLPSTAFRQRL